MTRGFSIVETLVALSIFSIALVAMVSVSARGVTDITGSKNVLTANYLAQEGIETIRNIRDTEMLNGGGWGNFMTKMQNCTQAGGCAINPIFSGSNPAVCATTTQCDLWENKVSGYYGYTANAVKSPFNRTITVRTQSPDEIILTSTVSWGSRSVSVTENMFNWQF